MSDPMQEYKVMRMTLPTDVKETQPDYQGSFSNPFRIPEGTKVIGADWSIRGEVTITYLMKWARRTPIL